MKAIVRKMFRLLYMLYVIKLYNINALSLFNVNNIHFNLLKWNILEKINVVAHANNVYNYRIAFFAGI